MTLSLSMDPSQSMKIIAFWLWIEANGDAQRIIRTVSSFNDASLISLATGAGVFIDALRHLPTVDDGNSTIPVNHLFRQEAVRQISHLLRSVCFPALGDIGRAAEERRMEQMSRISVGRRVAPPVAGDGFAIRESPELPEDILTSTMLRAVLESELSTERRRSLPPPSFAAAQVRHHDNIPREERMLFVTFSNGYPLTEQELHDFFTR